MLYLLAILLPPIAVLLAGRPVQAVLNVVLCLLLYIPGIIHALLVVHEHKANQRMDRLADRLKQ